MPPEGVGNQVPWRREVVAVSEELARAYRARVIFGPFAPARLKEASALEGEIGQPIPPAYLYRLGRDKQGAYGWGNLLGEYRQLPHSWLAGQLPASSRRSPRTYGPTDRRSAPLWRIPVSHGRRTGRRLVALPPGRLADLLGAIPASLTLIVEPVLASPTTRTPKPPKRGLDPVQHDAPSYALRP
jgi:hypothetical protein